MSARARASLLALALVAAVTALGGGGWTARAQDRPAARGDQASGRVGVLLLGVGSVDDETAGALTEVLIAAVAARTGMEIFDTEVFQDRLGQTERETAACVSQPPCVARVAIQLGLATVIIGTVGPRPGGYSFTLHRLDARSGRTLGTASEDVTGDLQAVIRSLRAAIPALYAPPRSVATLLVRSSVEGSTVTIDGRSFGRAPVRRRDVRPGRHAVVVRASGHRTWRRSVDVDAGAVVILEATLEPIERSGSALAQVLTITGGALAIGGGASGLIFGLLSQSSVEARTRADAVDAVEQRRAQALVANVSFVAAGIGAATAAFLLIVTPDAVFGGGAPDDDPSARGPRHRRVSFVAGPTRDGFVLGAGGEL